MKAKTLPQGLNVALIGATLVTLGLWTGSFDQLIFPKFILLILSGALLIGFVVGDSSLSKILPFTLLSGLFLAFFIMASIQTKPIHTALFGVQGRNMGLLSYFALMIFALYFVGNAQELVAERTINVFLGTSVILMIYGLMQRFDSDPFKWNLVYEGIIGTLGNPNFMSTFMALGAVALVGVIFLRKKRKPYLIPSVVVFAGFLIAMEASKSTQGWIVLLIGLLPIMFFQLEKVSRLVSRIFVGTSAALLILLGLALNQIGPLSRYIYEQSLQFRADFWSIAWRMALENPWFGVGIDRYQNFYREFKTIEQVSRVGAEDFSDSAHNLYLHFAATGGFPLALTFLALNLYIGFRFIVAYRKFAENKVIVATLFGLWLGIQAQSLISIDHPAIALWGWIFGGIGVGLSLSREEKKFESLGKKYIGLSVSIVTSVIALVFIAPVLQAQSMLLKGFYAYVEKGDEEAIRVKSNYLKDLEGRDSGNPTLPILSANSLFQDEAFKEAADAARRAILIDEHDYRAWWFLASALEKDGLRAQAIEARSKTIELAPYNLVNLLELARNQAEAGDSEGLKKTQEEMRQIDSNAAETKEAIAIQIN